ncbi:MAG TPA: efflux RND transporter permease subunit, partial [Candidatus Obscuribacterales bacterium]
MNADFFIRRPILATVCALLIVLVGTICIPLLPLAEYPDIAPPRVSVTANYIGASAQVVESAVSTILEHQINGITQTKYLTSTSGNDGTSQISVTFDLERDVDLAAVDVQSRVAQVEGRLPEEVKRTGISVEKVSTAFLLAIGLYDPDGKYDTQFLSNYADLYIRDALKRVKGVGDVIIFGERKYSMRVWLNPAKMAQHRISAMDVVNAVREQNVQVAAGQVGQPPMPSDQMYQMSVKVMGRLKTPEEFDNLIIKTGKDGSIIRLRDVGRAELGAEDYQTVVRYRGRANVGLGVLQRPGSNAIEAVKGVREEMARLSKYFPAGLRYEFAFDTTRSVSESISEVLRTLALAIALVVLTIFVFLQNWRSTIIPVITIPVSLIGTFAFMKLLGFSINTLTLFGIVLATGLVVDDAIVVIENISRFISEKRMGAVQAAREAMREVASAVIAISLVLVAVFVPVAFFPGTTGQLYKQFALTIACSVSISAFNALTLTPALSALWLRGGGHESGHWIFRPFNAALDWLRGAYGWSLGWTLKLKVLAIAVFIATMGATWWLFKAVPNSFIPNEDQGYFITIVQGPEGVSLNYTRNVLKQVEKIFDGIPEIESTFGVA